MTIYNKQQLARYAREAEARAQQWLDSAPRCEACGMRMVMKGHKRHGLCDPSSLMGMACTCFAGCTDKAWGDQGTCDPNCEPCKVMRGRIYRPPS